MRPILINLSNDHPLIRLIEGEKLYEIADITLHNFPDGEIYIKFERALQNREVIILCGLEHPNCKILPLLFLAETAKELGAKQIGLCAPYLSYMRQDRQFKSGEGITSDYFAKLLSRRFDWLVTVDPHLHRRHSLGEIYTIPNTVLHAAPLIAQWIANEIENPVLIGPDKESEQWVSEVAQAAAAPYLILEKVRHGDHDVEISQSVIDDYLEHVPVLIDDIISTARTMIEIVNHLNKLNMKPAVCIGVHGIFADKAYDTLLQAGVERIVTYNTINHPSNAIDLSSILVDGVKQQLEGA